MDEKHDGLERCPNCDCLVLLDGITCPMCGKDVVELGEVEGHRILTDRIRDSGSADLYRDRERGK
jgi:hypothetical protein